MNVADIWRGLEALAISSIIKPIPVSFLPQPEFKRFVNRLDFDNILIFAGILVENGGGSGHSSKFNFL